MRTRCPGRRAACLGAALLGTLLKPRETLVGVKGVQLWSPSPAPEPPPEPAPEPAPTCTCNAGRRFRLPYDGLRHRPALLRDLLGAGDQGLSAWSLTKLDAPAAAERPAYGSRRPPAWAQHSTAAREGRATAALAPRCSLGSLSPRRQSKAPISLRVALQVFHVQPLTCVAQVPWLLYLRSMVVVTLTLTLTVTRTRTRDPNPSPNPNPNPNP